MEGFKALLNKHQRIAIDTCEEIPHDHSNYMKYLNPAAPILHKVNEISDQFGKDAIGVHIRRTDNEAAIKHSPLELFTKEVDKAVNKGQKIFLATDDTTIEAYYLQRHPKNVIVNSSKNFNREDIDGVKDAMIDLYCLANTSHIYGSFWSSFTNVAARINQIPLTVLKLENIEK